MDIPKVKKLYDIIGDLALSITTGKPKPIEFPYVVVFVKGHDYLHSIVMASCDSFDGAVEEMDRQDSLFDLDGWTPGARLTVVRLRYVKGLVEWKDTLPLVPVG